ncbi:MAG TPA: hypothetical protein PK720_02575 [bacterium]|nr:hypothetical protein [bacterium]
MKYLGEGYYYRVYEVEPDRVFKKLQPYWFSFKKIFKYTRENGNSITEALIRSHTARLREIKALKSIKEKLSKIPHAIFANPLFVKGLNYSQDKVIIVADILEKNSFNTNKNIIDQYIEFQKVLWSYQMHDKTYKLQPNYGLNRNEKLVCIDFGEFAYTKEEALKSINRQKWLTRNTYKNWTDIELKNYYTECMKRLMTKKNLNNYWGRVPI